MPPLDLTNRKPEEERNKLPKPSNEGLKELFVDVDRVIIKDGGVYDDKAMSDQILLTINQADKVRMFHQLMEINENSTGFYCMCLGTYAIELYKQNSLKATIGFHHNVSIRYYKWNGDAELAKNDDLLTFLAEEGLTQPLADRIEQKRNQAADRIAQRKWLEISPRCFNKYWEQIIGLDDSYYPSLISDLNLEIPDKQKQIIALLQTFGKTDQFWTGYPSYEVVPEHILKTFEVKDIMEAYIQSDRNYKTRKGLGRFVCSFEFKKTRKKYLKYITHEIIEDLEKCFDWLGDKRGINEIFSLRNDKNKNSAKEDGLRHEI
ncbi:hypothetical protein L3C95_21370 [Chitinophaga filiformis]|uniref:hypothetical protein n=1 Tax=Chitinophaga filiformis TaxID=104663 RepID=UPI001F1A37A7|nr:hypothetical protein [Chitinophaga filiformis]MCF6405468.1 hypothetical protein [Chitinophaga filiformis]